MKKLIIAIFLCAASVLQAQEASRPMLIHGKMPSTNSNKLYRVQVGAFSNNNYFISAFELLKKNDFDPVYENYQNYRRLLLTKIMSDDVRVVVYRLGRLGFKELIITEEWPVAKTPPPVRRFPTSVVVPSADHVSKIYIFED